MAASVEDFKLENSFQHLRKTLLNESYVDRLDKPLAYWALPNDRRLPLAFLGRSLKDLLGTPFGDLAATPGIGQKKIGSLMKLLVRATREEPTVAYTPAALGADEASTAAAGEAGAELNAFDPTIVSEALWVLWRNTVKQHAVGHEKLGRLAPTLRSLPTVIWHTPLATYCDHSLAEVRKRRTHGEKRVRAILEVFFAAHRLLSQLPPDSHLAIQLRPQFIAPLEHWIAQTLTRSELPSEDEVRSSLAMPLIEQLAVDSGATVSRLAESRLGLSGSRQSVRLQSKRLGVTRARVYQLLEECSKIMHVRWPEGEAQLKQLASKLAAAGPPAEASRQMVHELLELFYPQGELSELDAA